MSVQRERIRNLKLRPHQSPVIFYHTASYNGLTIKHCRLRPGELAEFSCPEHQIAVPLAGSFISDVHLANGQNQTTYGLVGYSCLVPAHQPYSARWQEEMEYLAILLEPAVITRVAGDLVAAERVELVSACRLADPLIRQLSLTLMAEAEAPTPAEPLYIESLTNTLALHLLRYYTTGVKLPLAQTGGLPRHKLRRVIEYLNDHLIEEVLLADLAKAADLSPFHFARAFKQSMGQTPQQYLMQQRVECAKRLLAQSDLPLVEVGAQAGFKNQSHFTTIFRKLTAMTPRAYRNAMLR